MKATKPNGNNRMKPSYSIFFWLAVFLTLIASCFAFSMLVRFHIILWKSCKLHKLKPDQPRYYFNWPILFREISTESQSLFSKKLRATNRQSRNISVCLYNSTYHSLYSESNQVANVLSNDVSKFFQTSFESSLMITFIEGHFYPKFRMSRGSMSPKVRWSILSIFKSINFYISSIWWIAPPSFILSLYDRDRLGYLFLYSL